MGQGRPDAGLGQRFGLKNVAAKELQDVTDANAQVALGDSWRQLAAGEEGAAKNNPRTRIVLV